MNKVFYHYVLLTLFIFTPVLDAQNTQTSKWRPYERDLKKHRWINLSEDIFYPGDQTIDVIYYKLDLTVTSSPDYVKGSVTIFARVDTTNIDSLFLDFAQNMIVDSIILQETTPAQFNHIDDIINIRLDRNYMFNEVITLNVFYQGLPNSTSTGSGFKFRFHNGVPVIFSCSEPYFANYWWPCKDTPSDKADSADIILTVDTSLIPISNGSLENIINNSNGTHTYSWKVSYPIAQYLISVAISNYQLYTNYYVYSENDSMAITNYLYPESYTAQNLSKLDLIPEMLEIFSSLFGEYPFINEKFGHAECYADVEHQTITSIVAFEEILLAHETAHQWFGDKVTCKDWHHIWLNESFASFGDALWKEFKYGRTAYNQEILNLMNISKPLNNSVWVEDISHEGNLFSLETYVKGVVVLHMLRGVMGDSLLFKSLYNYMNDPELAYGVATTEDFQTVAENVYEEDLNYFFSEWIYGKKHPKYRIYWGKEQVNDSWNLGIKIEQIVNVSPPFFTMPIEIKINYSENDTIIKLFNNSQIQEYTLNLPLEPVSIDFDPNNWILKDVLAIVSSVDEENNPDKFILSQNYPNPFNNLTIISYQIPVADDVCLKVYNILGKEIATLVDEHKAAGKYEAEFDASAFPSGIYFYQLEAGEFTSTNKMILIK